MIKKELDLGEYKIKVLYDKETGMLEVSVYDELGDGIESIVITNDEDDVTDNTPNLN